MGATVRVVLRSTLAPWIALIGGALSQIALLAATEPTWHGEYFWSAMTVETDMYPAVIATALAIGIDCVRVVQPRRNNLLVSDELRPRFLRGYLLLLALGTAVPLLLTFVGTMTTWDSIFGMQQLGATVHVLVVLLSISAILMATLLIGWMSSLAATVLCPLVGLWLSLVALNQTGLITIGSSSGSMLGTALAWGPLAIQAVTALLVLAIGYILLASSRHPGGQLSWRAVGSVAIVVALGISGGLQLAPYRPTTEADSACYGDGHGGSRTCMSVQHERLLDPLDQRFLEFQAAAAEVGVEDALPRTVVEDYTAHSTDAVQGDQRIGPDVAAWRPNSEELSAPDPRISQESLAYALVDPSFCPQMQSTEGPSNAAFELVDEGQSAALTMVDDSASMSDRTAAAEHLKTVRSMLMSCDF